MTPSLRLVFWETTKACNLTCRHCRAVPQRAVGRNELNTNRALDLIDEIARVAKPVMVLSGGEPLFRPDLFDSAEYGVATGFRMALATNGTLVLHAGFAASHRFSDASRRDARRRGRHVSLLGAERAPSLRGISARRRQRRAAGEPALGRRRAW